MEILKRFQIRGAPGNVSRTSFDGRIVDFWSPENPTHLIIAHDGQNIFDKKSATMGQTWELAQSAIRVSEDFNITPPAIIGDFHSSTKKDSFGRIKDLAPQKPFLGGVTTLGPSKVELSELRGDKYLAQIAQQNIPTISKMIGLEPSCDKTALIGSSMGGLATLYGVGQYPELYGTALAFSPHWVIGGNPLVDALIDGLPELRTHKLWMSRGTKGLDRSYTPYQDYADMRAEELGWKVGHNFSTKVYDRTGHNERSWRKYLDEAIRFWMRTNT